MDLRQDFFLTKSVTYTKNPEGINSIHIIKGMQEKNLQLFGAPGRRQRSIPIRLPLRFRQRWAYERQKSC